MYIPKARVNGYELESVDYRDLDQMITTADCVIIVTDHTYMDYPEVLAQCKLVVDTRNALKGLTDPKIVRI